MLKNENVDLDLELELNKKTKTTNTIDKFIMIIGEESSGRKSISRLLNESLEEYEIEYVRKMYKFTYNNTNFQIFTSGMQTRYIKEPGLWSNYCAQCQGIIFVVDSSDTFSFSSVSEELSWLLNQELLNNKPILIFANKSDRTIHELKEISKFLKLESTVKDRKFKLLFSSVVENIGITEGIAWIINKINNK